MENNKQVEQWPINRLVPYERNPRHNEGAVDAVVKSIQEFGFQNPILVDENDVIISGHTRRMAAMKLGLQTVPVLVVRGLTPEQVKALRITDNKSSEFALWDSDLLAAELEALKLLDFDLSVTGFDTSELDRLFNGYDTDIFDGLIENNFMKTINNESPVFSISLNFPVEYRDTFEQYLRKNKKTEIEQLVINHISGGK